MLEIINKSLAIGTILSQISIALIFIFLIFFRKGKNRFVQFLASNSLKLCLAIALIATAGSLFYSNYAGFTPCVLCWYQRIFMYPLVILFLVALIKKDFRVINYVLPLSVIGLLISVYHNYIYIKGLGSAVCRIGESCVTPYVTEFGYITIPMMAFTAFLLITALLVLQRLSQKYV